MKSKYFMNRWKGLHIAAPCDVLCHQLTQIGGEAGILRDNLINAMDSWWFGPLQRQFTSRPDTPDSKVHRANMGPIWVRQDLGGPYEPFYLGRHSLLSGWGMSDNHSLCWPDGFFTSLGNDFNQMQRLNIEKQATGLDA